MLQRSARLALGGTLFFLAACPDASSRFDDFHERFLEANPAAPEMDGGSSYSFDASFPDAGEGGVLFSPEQFDGRMLFALYTPLSPKPIWVEGQVVAPKSVPGGVDADMVFVPLSRDDAKTRTDVENNGELQIRGPVFRVPKFSAVLPPAANPLFAEEDVVVELTLLATLAPVEGPVEAVCGDLIGKITQPLEIALDESTFEAVRIVDGKPWPIEASDAGFRLSSDKGCDGQ